MGPCSHSPKCFWPPVIAQNSLFPHSPCFQDATLFLMSPISLLSSYVFREHSSSKLLNMDILEVQPGSLLLLIFIILAYIYLFKLYLLTVCKQWCIRQTWSLLSWTLHSIEENRWYTKKQLKKKLQIEIRTKVKKKHVVNNNTT